MNESSTITDTVQNRTASAIELQEVTKRFLTPSGEAYTAIRDVTLSVAPGEFCAVVGPTGCGKSTTLGLISGLERPSQGSVQVMGQPVQGIDPRIGYVFQSDAVFPWKNVLNNVATGPLFRGQPKAEALALAHEWIGRVVLTAGPGTVKGIYRIDLPRPRKVEEIRFEPRFVQLYHEIWEDLREEVRISYERNKQRIS